MSPRNVTPKNAMKEKVEVEDGEKHAVFGPGMTKPEIGEGGNVFFVGLRASGKTTLGRKIASRLGRPFVDTDALILKRSGKTVAQIVTEDGWDEFRRLETAVLAEVVKTPGQVVGTGGGIVLAQANRELLLGGGPVFYLIAETTVLVDRLMADLNPDQRPALSDSPLAAEMAALMDERNPLYMEVANFVLQAGSPLEELVEDVLEKLRLVERLKR